MLEGVVESDEATLPEAPVVLDPFCRLAHRPRDQPELVHAADLATRE
jgi:hypothetical protein